MSNEFFKFKQFTIYHDKCAMKVGTDGVLLGAWAPCGKKILDIGAGTGLISIMMAQRSETSMIDGIEIDADSTLQARNNVNNSAFCSRINMLNTSLQVYFKTCIEKNILYDSIVSNPPFYTEDTVCPDNKRHTARHTDSLTYKELFSYSTQLLTNDGVLSIIVPYESENKIMLEACVNGLFVKDICYIKTTPKKNVKRIMVTFSKTKYNDITNKEVCMMNPDGSKSEWYKTLTEDFYL